MEYTKQAWTAPTGTGLSRYAKSAESASHVTLTLDPENLTNTPTPFTMARMAHMEDGIAKAYDTAPPTPWAQYSGKDIPQLPDNLAGTTQKVTEFTSASAPAGWSTSVSPLFELVGTKLKIIASQQFSQIYRSFINLAVCVTIDEISGIWRYDGKTAVIGKNVSYKASGDINLYCTTSAGYVVLSAIYIGTGAYDRLVFDNSYHYRHLLNNAVIPTPQGLYFNGETSYLRSKEPVTLPDVFTFSATVNCAVKSTTQVFFGIGNNTIITDAQLYIYRLISSNSLVCHISDGTSIINIFTDTSFFTGFDNKDVNIKVEIDFTNKKLYIYKNNALVTAPTNILSVLKPTGTITLGNSQYTNTPLLGYMRNICIFDTSLTDTQRNWLAQGNTPPILYDVTNYELEQGVAPITEGVETIRRDEDFTMNTYLDGKKLRIANTDDAQITCTLPSGQTMNGQSSFTIAPDTLLEFELIGTSWKCVSKEWEILWENPTKASSFVSQLVTLSAVKEQFKRLVFTYGAFSGGDGYSNVHTKEIQTSTTSTRLIYIGFIVGNPESQRTREVVNITGNSLEFKTGYTVSSDNSAIIPYAIYGIK